MSKWGVSQWGDRLAILSRPVIGLLGSPFSGGMVPRLLPWKEGLGADWLGGLACMTRCKMYSNDSNLDFLRAIASSVLFSCF